MLTITYFDKEKSRCNLMFSAGLPSNKRTVKMGTWRLQECNTKPLWRFHICPVHHPRVDLLKHKQMAGERQVSRTPPKFVALTSISCVNIFFFHKNLLFSKRNRLVFVNLWFSSFRSYGNTRVSYKVKQNYVITAMELLDLRQLKNE